MDINSPSSSEDESEPNGQVDDRMQQLQPGGPQQGGAQPEQLAASDTVETLIISFNGGEPAISGSSLDVVISERTRGNVRAVT